MFSDEVVSNTHVLGPGHCRRVFGKIDGYHIVHITSNNINNRNLYEFQAFCDKVMFTVQDISTLSWWKHYRIVALKSVK
jgi:hypothetical protein